MVFGSTTELFCSGSRFAGVCSWKDSSVGYLGGSFLLECIQGETACPAEFRRGAVLWIHRLLYMIALIASQIDDFDKVLAMNILDFFSWVSSNATLGGRIHRLQHSVFIKQPECRTYYWKCRNSTFAGLDSESMAKKHRKRNKPQQE